VMQRDSAKMRDGGPTVFASIKHNEGVDEITQLILRAWSEASGVPIRKA
jgi:urease accessory protein